MKVPESALQQVVESASKRIAETEYVSNRVDQLIAEQPNVMQYVVAHQQELDMHGIVEVLFHASLIQESVQVAGGSSRQLDFAALDTAATGTPDLETLSKDEPEVASYIVSNVDLEDPQRTEVARRLLGHIARALTL